MGLRQMLPVQTKRTFFTIAGRGGEGVGQGKINRHQVNERSQLPERATHLDHPCLTTWN
jgi:hypothetical protein